MQGHAGEGDRQQLVEMRATGRANGKMHASAASPLRRAADVWLRNGYRLEFDDEHLVQVAAPFRALSPRDFLLCAIFGAGLGVLASLTMLGILWQTRRRRWHVVSLLLTPDRQVLTHEQWLPAPVPE
ncbi:MAG TPA: hypothetical protein VF120_18520 [Ktedonobacterales bacterium]